MIEVEKMGLVTIGQTPRADITPELKKILGRDIQIVEKGALDGLSLEEVKDLYPKPREEVLVTRMADGTAVQVAGEKVFPLLKEKIKELERDNIGVIFLACTGEFPGFDTKSLLIKPQKLLHYIVKALVNDQTLGVLIPDEKQVASARERWSKVATNVIIEHCSPYDDISKIKIAAEHLLQAKADLVVMDCIGYTLKMKEMVSSKTKRPVILARSVSAKVISELLFYQF